MKAPHNVEARNTNLSNYKESLRERLMNILNVSGLSDRETNPPLHAECERITKLIVDVIERDVGKIIITQDGGDLFAELSPSN